MLSLFKTTLKYECPYCNTKPSKLGNTKRHIKICKAAKAQGVPVENRNDPRLASKDPKPTMLEISQAATLKLFTEQIARLKESNKRLVLEKEAYKSALIKKNKELDGDDATPEMKKIQEIIKRADYNPIFQADLECALSEFYKLVYANTSHPEMALLLDGNSSRNEKIAHAVQTFISYCAMSNCQLEQAFGEITNRAFFGGEWIDVSRARKVMAKFKGIPADVAERTCMKTFRDYNRCNKQGPWQPPHWGEFGITQLVIEEKFSSIFAFLP